ncbi:hypothetical protein QFC22_001031 [Naganishia vaughanmartiniae]|uniref:Uncharacterized protein n=1 Tax=Naganishia vaughanmartiniae TaxID=1424756 RepID=A0ACC2XKS0_9TREE|nr:hypothetical protein QFC22_001031 [Naganishia vaughanmartiniae]
MPVTPPKYCSKRCKSVGKPSLAVVSTWRTMLEDAAVGGNKQTVLCSDVQREVFAGAEEGAIDRGDDTERGTPSPNTQELGMIKAKQREDTRRAARLIYQFGFQHFAPAAQILNANIGPPSSAAKSSNRKKSNRAGDAEPQDAKVEAMQNGKVIQDVTHAKGEWGLRYKRD